MKTLYMTLGLPASGKTTWAKAKLKELGNAKRINKDDLRAMLDDSHWSKTNEAFVLGVRDALITAALSKGFHVIVDDTNLAPKHETTLKTLALLNNAQFEVVDFTHVSLEECIKRDQKRHNYVGETVIRDMWEQFLKPKNAEPPVYDDKLPDAIIVDVDGTVAHNDGHRGFFEWNKVGGDKPRFVVRAALLGFLDRWVTATPIFVSGRDESCRKETEQWFREKLVIPTKVELLMRPAGDMRKDSIVKREIYEQHLKAKYNIVAIFDDRKSCLRLWESLGYGDRIFNVGRVDDNF